MQARPAAMVEARSRARREAAGDWNRRLDEFELADM
jgi:hypothetical protein